MSENGTNLSRKNECAILQPTITPEDLQKQLALIESQITQVLLIKNSIAELGSSVRDEVLERKGMYAGNPIPVDGVITKLSECQLSATESSRISDELFNTLLKLKENIQTLLVDFDTNTTTNIEH